jgi:hypothetical protein
VIEPDFGDQALEARPAVGARSRLAQVVIDDDDALARPAQLDRAIDQAILQLGRLLVVKHLVHGRLPYVHHGGALPVPRVDLRRRTPRVPSLTRGRVHRSPFARRARRRDTARPAC